MLQKLVVWLRDKDVDKSFGVLNVVESSTTPLLSVIVPIYNVAPYIKDCITSIKQQTLHDIEVVLVDDGSTDDSLSIAKQVIGNDRRFRTIHTKHGGPAKARNLGVKMANGRYLAFADSDDLVPADAYETMVQTLEGSGSDIATGRSTRFNSQRQWNTWNQKHSHVSGSAQSVTLTQRPELIYDTQVWNKVYRREFYMTNHIRFPANKLYEDMVPTLYAYTKAAGIDVVDHVVYKWRSRDSNDSITQRRHESPNLDDKLLMIKRSMRLLRPKEYAKLKELYTYKALFGDLWFYIGSLPDASEKFRKTFAKAALKLWSDCPDEMRDRLLDKQRLFYSILANTDIDTAVSATRWWDAQLGALPVAVHGGKVAVDLEAWISQTPKAVATKRWFGLDSEIRLKAGLCDAVLQKNTLTVYGWALMSHLGGADSSLDAALRARHQDVTPGTTQIRRIGMETTGPARLGNTEVVEFAAEFSMDEILGRTPNAKVWDFLLTARAGDLDRSTEASALARIPWLPRARAIALDGEFELAPVVSDGSTFSLRKRRRGIELTTASAHPLVSEAAAGEMDKPLAGEVEIRGKAIAPANTEAGVDSPVNASVDGHENASVDKHENASVDSHEGGSTAAGEGAKLARETSTDFSVVVHCGDPANERTPVKVTTEDGKQAPVRPAQVFVEEATWPLAIEINSAGNFAVSARGAQALVTGCRGSSSQSNNGGGFLVLEFDSRSVVGLDTLAIEMGNGELVALAALVASATSANSTRTSETAHAPNGTDPTGSAEVMGQQGPAGWAGSAGKTTVSATFDLSQLPSASWGAEHGKVFSFVVCASHDKALTRPVAVGHEAYAPITAAGSVGASTAAKWGQTTDGRCILLYATAMRHLRYRVIG